nr:receptor-like protein kinase feronia [Quercus suber]
MLLPRQVSKLGFAMDKDYVVLVPNGSPQQNIWLVLHPVPSSKPDYYDVTLSGVEILKANGTNGNLARPNPIPAPKQDVIDPTRARASSDGGKTKNQKAIIIGCVGGGIVLALILGFFLIAASRRRHGKDLSARISTTTKNFDEAQLLGIGGFGKVYKGEIDNEATKIAIKHGNPLSGQGVDEFQTEIEMLSNLRHFHLFH